ASLGVFSLLVAATVLVPANAEAASNSGTSSGHTLCVTAANTLTGEQTVTVTNSPNSGLVFATWVPSGGTAVRLIQIYAPSPSTNDYSFVWPTQKYLDGSGTLSLQAGSIGSAAVMIAVTLSNTNATDFKHNPNDWMSYLPAPWAGANDPHILATGDGPSNEVTSNAMANRIAAVDPPLFLFLGDIYETGTFTENLNHYGVSNIDHPTQGTFWGATADTTQPTLGNHEKVNIPAWMDYWHGRPVYTSWTWGGVLFLDLNSSQNMTVAHAEYNFAQSVLTNPNNPACVVAMYHEPAVTGNTTIASNESDMWKLLANNGVDLVLNGHQHNMEQYKPLDQNFTAGPGAHMVQLVAGSGGHGLTGVTNVPPGARIEWSKGKTAGLLDLTLNGAGSGNAATSIGWQWQDVNGNDLHDGSVDCGTVGNHAPVVNAGPDQSVKLPAQATMQGSVTDDGLPNPPATVTNTWSQVSGPGTATFTDAHSLTTTVSFDAAGTYVLRLTADDSALQASDNVTITVLPEGATTLTVPIGAGSDDAEESSLDGSVALANPALKIVNRAGVIQTVGLRFAGLSIPKGATIQSAYIQFQCRVQTTAAASLLIEGQAADNPGTFTKTTNNISSRSRTSADVGWVPAPWGTVGAQGSDQQTPGLTNVMQEIVNRAGWTSGNSMVFIITGTGVRTAESFEGLFAPVLHVTYA
ncbi:MAG: metallophosphoesterase, partial [Actinomycetota bacterium]|nr:metallophosphoesterase [Actinomycetota bacterium]